MKIAVVVSYVYIIHMVIFIFAAIYHCCTEAGTSTPSAMELGMNGYVDKSLSTSLIIKGEAFSSVRVSA